MHFDVQVILGEVRTGIDRLGGVVSLFDVRITGVILVALALFSAWEAIHG